MDNQLPWLGVGDGLSIDIVQDRRDGTRSRDNGTNTGGGIMVFAVHIGHTTYNPLSDICQLGLEIQWLTIDIRVSAPFGFLTCVGAIG